MAEVIVETASGKVRGQQGRRASVFEGIACAAPPPGENRFRPRPGVERRIWEDKR
jgi:carboxylesterase type B